MYNVFEVEKSIAKLIKKLKDIHTTILILL